MQCCVDIQYQVHLRSLGSLSVVDGGYPMIGTFLIRPNAYPAKIWKKIAQNGRIIKDVLHI